MLNIFCFLVFLAGTAFAEERIAHFEGSPSGIAGGFVNVISGAPVLGETDLVIPGVEPLYVHRVPLYAPGYFPKGEVRESWNFPFMERIERDVYYVPPSDPPVNSYGDKERLVVHQGSQALLGFAGGKLNDKYTLPFSRYDHPKGYTNQWGQERPTGRAALKNTSIERTSTYGATLFCSSGEVRKYQGNPKKSAKERIWLRLEELTRPNGFKHRLAYDNKQAQQGRTLLSPTEKEIAYYRADDQGDKLHVESFDGRTVNYTFDNTKGKAGSTLRFLKHVERSDGPPIAYSYATEDLDNGQLRDIRYPEGRGVTFTYWPEVKEKRNRSSRKVKAIFQPAGPDATPIQTHTFSYHTKGGDSGWTDVIDHEGNKDVYLFDADYRIREIRHYKGLEEKLFFEQFFWDGEGQLTLSALLDGTTGRLLRGKAYAYDKEGNTTEERVLGNLSGHSKTLPLLNEQGKTYQGSIEIYRSYFEYTDNLLTKERHDNGLSISYRYLPGTDLLTEKSTFLFDVCAKKESFTYDASHCLIESTEEEGERKTICRFTLLERPFGYPQEKRVFGFTQEAGEVFLESYHYTYNRRGDKTSEERRDNQGRTLYTLEWNFDDHGNCIREKNALGDITTRIFDVCDNCVEEQGPRLTKTFIYDWMNRCTKQTVSYQDETRTTTTSYNIRGNPTSTTDHFGQITRHTYDRFGNALTTTLPPLLINGTEQCPLIHRTFDLLGNVASSTDPLGRTTYTGYTSRGQPTLIRHPDGTTERFQYTFDGQLTETTDQEGASTRNKYDPLGRLLSKETPFGTEYFSYTGMRLTRSTDLTGNLTTYSYDPFGRLSTTTCGNRKEALTYDAYGHLSRKSYYEGEKLLKTEVTLHDALGRVIESFIEDPATSFHFCPKRFVYDSEGNCLEEWDGDVITTKTYDIDNRVTSVIDPLGHVHNVVYHQDRVLAKTVTDPLGNQTIALYNTHGQKTQVIHPELSSKMFFYNLAGELEKEETSTSETTQTLVYERDAMGRITSLIEPLGKVTRTSYTPLGNIATLTKPNGLQLFHTYDRGRLSSLKSSDGALSYAYRYSPKGELLEVFDAITGFTSRQCFSPHGDLIEECLPTGQIISYAHDGLGRTTSYSLPDGGKVHLTYNAVALTSVTRCNSAGKPLYTHAYTRFTSRGDIEEEQLIGHAGTVTCSYDPLFQLKSLLQPQLRFEALSYDAVGNLLSLQRNDALHSFSYDNLYQLVEENAHTYTFDALYNRRSKDKASYEINALNQLLSTADHTYTYDPNGNLTRLDDIFLSYDPLDRLLSIKKDNETVSFAYDPFHRCLSQNGTPFYFYGLEEIGDPHSLRILGEGIRATIAIELNHQIYAPLHDFNGSITALLNLEGNLVDAWNYTAYGEALGSSLSPWTFSSKRPLPLTNWLTFNRRLYDPQTGRWTTPDPLGFDAGPNLYTYVSNRPLTHRDPLGLFALSAPTLSFNGQDLWQNYGQNLLQNPRFQGGLRAVGGLSEMMAGAVGGVATAWSGVGLVAGGLAVAHGTDNYVAGMRQLFTGEYTETVTSQSLQRLGLSAETANHIDNGLSIVGTLGGAAVVQSTQHVPRFASFFGTSVAEGMQLNRFHQTSNSVITRNPLSSHSMIRLSERGVSESMVRKTIEKGVRYFDHKEQSIAYVLNKGFASGKTLQVSICPETGRVITVIPRSKFNPNVEFNHRPRFDLME